jgi:hypothetical protein
VVAEINAAAPLVRFEDRYRGFPVAFSQQPKPVGLDVVTMFRMQYERLPGPAACGAAVAKDGSFLVARQTFILRIQISRPGAGELV